MCTKTERIQAWSLQNHAPHSLLEEQMRGPFQGRSSDLWALKPGSPSRIKFSGLPKQVLPNYSGGTVAESHSLPYSPIPMGTMEISIFIYSTVLFTEYLPPPNLMASQKVHQTLTLKLHIRFQ